MEQTFVETSFADLVDLGHIGHGNHFLEFGELVDTGQCVDQLSVQDLFLDVLAGHFEVGHQIFVIVHSLRGRDDLVGEGGYGRGILCKRSGDEKGVDDSSM